MGREGGEVCPLRDESPDQSVLVFVGAALTRRVWVAVVDGGAFSFPSALVFDAFSVRELGAVVAGDGEEDLRE